MRILVPMVMAAALPWVVCGQTVTAREIIALERQIMDALGKGNPGPLLGMLDPGVTYYHVMTNGRLDGLPAVRALTEPYRGQPLMDSYEMVEPRVQTGADTAVLTYVLVRHNRGGSSRWNATVVYQKKKEGWRVIHAHWSMTQPPTQ